MNCKGLDIVFTVIPPPNDWDLSKIERKAFEISNITRILDISQISIPEVIEEKQKAERVVPYKPKFDNSKFAEMIRKFDDVEVIINKVSVIIPKEDFKEWILEHSKKFNSILIVGGESSRVQYEGYHPIEATVIARDYFQNVYGITIFHRKNESQRLLNKTMAGMKAFISQIVFELESAKSVIDDYFQLCKINAIEPSKIFISFAPLSQKKDLEFLKWLGVYIPSEIENYLLEDERKLEKRSIEVIESLSQELCFLAPKDKIGINVEHVMYNNLQVAAYTIHRIKEVWGWSYTSR